MKTQLLTIVLLFIALKVPAQTTAPDMKAIFNGKDLDGWVIPEGNIWWTARDGVLTAKSGPDKKGSILWTKKPYKNFIFQTEFKMGEGTVDSGIFCREEQIQIQIGISGSLNRDMTASPYIPGKGYPKEADVKKLLDTTGWNTMKVEAKDNVFTVWLNDHEVMHYTAEKVEDQGPIGLQLHPGKEMSIDFRHIQATEL